MTKLRNMIWALLGLVVIVWGGTTLAGSVFGGPIDPPAAPAATQKTQIDSLPYTISSPGSYILMSNLDCPSCAGGGTDGITIAANFVTLDLSGFEVIGPGSAAGSGSGINVSGTRSGIRIENGAVRNWTLTGVQALSAVGSQLDDIRAIGNGGDGLRIGDGSTIGGSNCVARANNVNGIRVGRNVTITGCAASINGADGIQGTHGVVLTDCSSDGNGRYGVFAGDEALIDGCVAINNTLSGIFVQNSANISDCVARGNGADGIQVGTVSTIANCSSSGNTGAGILIGRDGVVTNCTATANGATGIDAYSADGRSSIIDGCTANLNGAAGISVKLGAVVRNNNADANSGAGIYVPDAGAFGSTNRIENNDVSDNVIGLDVNGTDNLIIGNSAHSNSTAEYDIVLGNHVGPVLVSPGDPIASTNPWANFDY